MQFAFWAQYRPNPGSNVKSTLSIFFPVCYYVIQAHDVVSCVVVSCVVVSCARTILPNKNMPNVFSLFCALQQFLRLPLV